jgi:hypothetical protein
VEGGGRRTYAFKLCNVVFEDVVRLLGKEDEGLRVVQAQLEGHGDDFRDGGQVDLQFGFESGRGRFGLSRGAKPGALKKEKSQENRSGAGFQKKKEKRRHQKKK